jgi:catechol 2,3-dioxygenase-like lactoylglutathione lyase family enzyme
MLDWWMPQQELQRISRWICGRKRGNEMITGVHHVCVKCRPEELEKVQKFYGELLGLPLVRSWGEPKVEGLMYGAGTSLIEIFPNAEEDLPQGAIRHFALATDDVDSIVEAARKAGYAVTMEPGDIEIMSKPSLPARIAFIIGLVGEEIELFCEKQ